MFIATLFTDPQEEPTWNEKIDFFKVLAGKSAQQKQAPNRVLQSRVDATLLKPIAGSFGVDGFGAGAAGWVHSTIANVLSFIQSLAGLKQQV